MRGPLTGGLLICLTLTLAAAPVRADDEPHFDVVGPFNQPSAYLRKLCSEVLFECSVALHIDAAILDKQHGRFVGATRTQPTTWDQSKLPDAPSEAVGPGGMAFLSASKVLVALDTAKLPLNPDPDEDFEVLKVKATSVAAVDSNADGKDEIALVVGRSLELWEWDAKNEEFKRKKAISLSPFAAATANGVDEAKTIKTVASVMEAGKRNGDKYEDLVIGLPDAKVANVAKAGVVLEFLGGNKGLSSQPNKVHTRATTQSEAGSEAVQPVANDRFGAQIYLVDFDDTGPENLLIGCPYCLGKAGAFFAERHDKSFLFQRLAGDPPGTLFGWSFTDANLNGDAFPDFVVGAPGADLGAAKNAGAIYGYLGGPAAAGSELAPTFTAVIGAPLGNLGQSTPLGFGAALEAEDIAHFGTDQVLVGSPCLNLPGKTAAGGILLLVFSPPGLFPPIHLDGALPGLASAKGYVSLPNGSSLLSTKKAMADLCNGK